MEEPRRLKKGPALFCRGRVSLDGGVQGGADLEFIEIRSQKWTERSGLWRWFPPRSGWRQPLLKQPRQDGEGGGRVRRGRRQVALSESMPVRGRES